MDNTTHDGHPRRALVVGDHMHHPAALTVELDLRHRQALEPEQKGRVLPCRVVLDRLNLRALNQARDLAFVTMNCPDNSHDHRGHGPYRVDHAETTCPVKFEEPLGQTRAIEA